MREWRDISTAPKDGTMLLLYGKQDTSGPIQVGFFSSNGPFSELAGTEGEWFVDLDGDPTHWMPLPAPPPTFGEPKK